MISGLINAFGMIILYIGYGKDYKGKYSLALSSIFTLMIVWWLFSLLMTFAAIGKDELLLCISVDVLVPVIITSWIIYARKKTKKMYERNPQN